MCLRCFGGYEGGMYPRQTTLLAPSPARPPPRHPAVRPDPTRPWCVRVLDATGKLPIHRVLPKGSQTFLFVEESNCRNGDFVGQQVETMRAPRRADETLCNQLVTGVFVSPLFFRHAWHNLSSPKPGHTTSGSGRGACLGGGAGSGKTGCQQNCSPWRQASL